MTRTRTLPKPMTLLAASLALQSCGTFADRQSLSRESGRAADDIVTGTWGITRTLTRATVLATAREPLTTIKVGAAMAWQRPTELIRGNLPEWFATEPAIAASPGGSAFERLLDEEGLEHTYRGTMRTLVDGKEFFPAFEKRLASANRDVKMQVFIFDNDDIAVGYARKLREKSHEVPVRILYDDLGTAMATLSAPETPSPKNFRPPDSISRFLSKNCPLEVRRTLNPWMLADHSKLMIFDNRVAMIGGMNMGREYFSEWHDLMVEVEGPVVERLDHHFDTGWRKAGFFGDFARRPQLTDIPEPQSRPDGVRVILTDIREDRYDTLKSLLLAIRASRSRVWLQTPYFSSDEVAREMIAAAKRGVDVRLVIPDRCDSELMEIGNLSTASDLMREGVKVYRYPGMTHLKAFLADNWAMVGSANLDTLSLRINRELNVASGSRSFVREIESRVFRRDFSRSRRLTEKEASESSANPIHSLAESIADQL